MIAILKLYSTSSTEIHEFLRKFYNHNIIPKPIDYWEKEFVNPLEMSDLIAAFIDNKDTCSSTSMWISVDRGVFIQIKKDNYNHFIQYLYERYPY